MVERLHRLEWLFERNPIYFFTACAHGRRKILGDTRIQKRLEAFAQNGPQHGAWLGAYVIMPDHLHGFVAVDCNLQLGEWVRLLKNALSHELRALGADTPHWQKGFFDHVLRSEESYAEKWDYVRNNPVRAGLVKRWQEWPYRGEPFRLELRRQS